MVIQQKQFSKHELVLNEIDSCRQNESLKNLKVIYKRKGKYQVITQFLAK